MNEILKFEGHDIRMVDQDGEPWWVVKDICDSLGLSNPSETVKRIDSDDLSQIEVIDGLGRKQKTYVVNQAGVYSLVLRSEKPEAKRFKRWITHEVLPSIRKTGSYNLAQQSPRDEFAIMRGMIDVLESNRRRITSLEGSVGTIESTVVALRDTVDLFRADTEYTTVRAHLRGANIKMGEKDARAVGVKAASLCRAREIRIGDVPDERHGSVHTYPIDVLDEAVAYVQSRPKQEPAKRNRN